MPGASPPARLRLSPGHPEQGQLPSVVLSHFPRSMGCCSRGCPVFSPDRCFFLGVIPTTSLRGVWSAPTHVSIHNDFGGRRRELGADGGSGAARVAERVAALGLSGVAAFCISKCALSAGALGRNCHLLPHCQPRRGYASFADSQPPALITRSTPSLEPPGQSRHIPSRCCTAGRRAGAGASTRTAPRARPCPRASLRGSGCS